MRILLTGATGHSGRWFIKRLAKEGFDGELVCIVREGRDLYHLKESGLNFTVVNCPVEDVDQLEIAMQGVDIVLHIAGIQVSNYIMEAVLANQIEWTILVHTTGRYSRYKSASAEYIRIEDQILKDRTRGLYKNVTIVRPTMIYGSTMDANMHKLILYLNKHKFFPLFGKGRNLMQPVHARDLGNAYYDIISKPETTKNKEYNLPGREALPYRDIINTVSKLLQSKNIIIQIPLGLSIFAARVYNGLFGDKAIITVEQVLRMQEHKDFSYEKAFRDFGYDPISFEQGISEEIADMKKAGLI